MDPITIIVSAIAAGATAGIKPTAEKAVKDAYEGVKAFIKKRFEGKVSIEEIEKNPDSQARRSVLAEDLKNEGAENDEELLREVQNLISTVKQFAPSTKVTGVNLEEVEAEFLNLKKLNLKNTGFNVKKSKFTKGIDLGEVTAEDSDSPNP